MRDFLILSYLVNGFTNIHLTIWCIQFILLLQLLGQLLLLGLEEGVKVAPLGLYLI